MDHDMTTGMTHCMLARGSSGFSFLHWNVGMHQMRFCAPGVSHPFFFWFFFFSVHLWRKSKIISWIRWSILRIIDMKKDSAVPKFLNMKGPLFQQVTYDPLFCFFSFFFLLLFTLLMFRSVLNVPLTKFQRQSGTLLDVVSHLENSIVNSLHVRTVPLECWIQLGGFFQ